MSGELLAAQLPVPPFHAEDHLSLVRGLLPFMSQTRSQVLMLQFSVAASSHCCQGKISCLATPQSSSAGKTSTLLFIHGLKLPTASYGFLAGFLSPRCIWKRFSFFFLFLSQNLLFWGVIKFHLLLFMSFSFIFIWLQLLLFDSYLFKSYAIKYNPALLFLLGTLKWE